MIKRNDVWALSLFIAHLVFLPGMLNLANSLIAPSIGGRVLANQSTLLIKTTLVSILVVAFFHSIYGIIPLLESENSSNKLELLIRQAIMSFSWFLIALFTVSLFPTF